jgi:hypothetical protein
MSRVFDLFDDALREKVGEMRYDTEARRFSMKILDVFTPEELPLSLDLFASAGKYELGHEDVLRWLRGRICPPGRQNIKTILKELGLAEYDEFGILMHTMARCGKDELYLIER